MRSARWLLAPLALFSLACSGVSPGSEAARTPAPDLTPVLGQWDGEITVGAARIWFIVDCVEDDGRLECTLDYPDAGLERQPLSEVSFVSGRLHFELEGDFGVAVWDGELRRGVVEGDYEESGVSAPFRMRRHPIGPAETIYLDYLVEEVEFASGDFILSGTLTMPLEGAPHPAVVLLSGSGPQTRDYGARGLPDVQDHGRSPDQQRHRSAPVRRSRRGLIDRRPARCHHRRSDRHHLGRAGPAAGPRPDRLEPDRGSWATARAGRSRRG